MASKHKRARVTAVILREGKVLLVRDRGLDRYSLPGGGIHKGEPINSAVTRELREELGLKVTKITRLRDNDFNGAVNNHRVCLIEVSGEPRIKGRELDRFKWWDMREPVPAYAHVEGILSKVVAGRNQIS